MDNLEDNRLIDPIDIGSQTAENLRQDAENRQRAKAAPKQVRNEDGTWPRTECDCGEPIGEVRLEHGYINCIACARIAEQKGKQYGR